LLNYLNTMKKLLTLTLLALLFASNVTFGQCTVNNSNTTPGFTPNNGTITQNAAYALTVQVYVPTTYNITTPITATVTVDSVHISSISGVPTGITYTYDAANVDGGGMTINGGHNGAICYAGTTSAAVGTDSLTFNGSAYVTIPGFGAQTVPLSQLKSVFSFVFTIQAGAASTCDTLFNLSSVQDTATIYLADTTVTAGYISGNNEYGDLIKAEGFGVTIGNFVNSALIYPALVTINPADSNTIITIGLWDNSGTDLNGHAGAPGVMFDSVHVTLGQFAQAVTASIANQGLVGLLVNFNNGVAITTDTIFVGVVLPVIAGDTIVIWQNTQFGVGGHAWEYELNYVTQDGSYAWGSYNEDWGFTAAGNYIVANVCSNAASAFPVASFTAPASACASSSITFTDGSTSNPAPSSWGWSFGDGSSSSSQNPAHTYASAGSYVVTESVSNNLGGAIQAFVNASQTITINPAPAATVNVHDASSSSSSNGSVVVTTTSGTSPYTYVWSAGGSTTDSLGGVNPGTYTVTITDANNCTTTASGVVYVTGILSLSNTSSVSIYPNPATDVLNLVWSKSLNTEISVLDMNGNIISTIINNGDMKTAFDIHGLAAGTYVVRITDKNTSAQHSTLFTKF
jgi:PKD repeat protein